MPREKKFSGSGNNPQRQSDQNTFRYTVLLRDGFSLLDLKHPCYEARSPCLVTIYPKQIKSVNLALRFHIPPSGIILVEGIKQVCEAKQCFLLSETLSFHSTGAMDLSILLVSQSSSVITFEIGERICQLTLAHSFAPRMYQTLFFPHTSMLVHSNKQKQRQRYNANAKAKLNLKRLVKPVKVPLHKAIKTEEVMTTVPPLILKLPGEKDIKQDPNSDADEESYYDDVSCDEEEEESGEKKHAE